VCGIERERGRGREIGKEEKIGILISICGGRRGKVWWGRRRSITCIKNVCYKDGTFMV